MIAKNDSIDITNLLQLTSSGLTIAKFREIRLAVINKFKEIYGDDITITDTNADGIFINNMSLMINNLLKSFAEFYSQLDISSATGNYLDRLCSLTNLYRKQGTKSLVELVITNNNTVDVKSPLTFSDVDGRTWTWRPENVETIKSAQTLDIVAYCDEFGPIHVNENSIISCFNSNISINSNYESNDGSYTETDEEFRSRQKSSLFTSNPTVVESMMSELFNRHAIKDVIMYVNDTNAQTTLSDGCKVNSHEVYLCLRYNNNVEIEQSFVPNVIYNYLTPGIKTIDSDQSVECGTLEQYTITLPKLLTTQTICWKNASPVSKSLTITIVVSSSFSKASIDKIAQAVKTYMNNLSMTTIENLKTTKSDVDLRLSILSATSTNDYYISNLVGFNDAITACKMSYFNFTGKYTIDSSTNTSYTFTIN